MGWFFNNKTNPPCPAEPQPEKTLKQEDGTLIFSGEYFAEYTKMGRGKYQEWGIHRLKDVASSPNSKAYFHCSTKDQAMELMDKMNAYLKEHTP